MKISIKRFVLLSLIGPIAGFLICLLVSGWRGSIAFGFVVGGGQFFTHLLIHKTHHRIVITLPSRLYDSSLADLRRGVLSDREELFLHRSHYITLLSFLAAITAGGLARSYAGLLYGFVAVVTAHLAGNRVIKTVYGPDIDAALMKTKEYFAEAADRFPPSTKATETDDLPAPHPFQIVDHDFWVYGPRIESEEREAYLALEEEVKEMPWLEAWREGRSLIKRLGKQLSGGSNELETMKTVARILLIQECHAGIVHWPRLLARLKLAGLTDSGVRLVLFIPVSGLLISGALLGPGGAILALVVAVCFFWMTSSVLWRRSVYEVFRMGHKHFPGSVHTNTDAMITRRWHTGIALIMAWPTLIAKLIYYFSMCGLGVFLVVEGYWIALVLPAAALQMVWLDLKDATTPPYAFVIGRSGGASVEFHLILRKVCYPLKVVSLLNHGPVDGALSKHARDDIFRVVPQWWARLVWLFVVRHVALASDVIIYDLRDGRSEYTDQELQMMRDLNLNVLFVGDNEFSVSADNLAIRFWEAKAKYFWKDLVRGEAGR